MLPQEQKKIWSVRVIIIAGIFASFIASAILTYQNLRQCNYNKKHRVFFWTLVLLFALMVLSSIIVTFNSLQYFVFNLALVLLLVLVQRGSVKRAQEENNNLIVHRKPGEAVLPIVISLGLVFLLMVTLPLVEKVVWNIFPSISGQPLYDPDVAKVFIYDQLTSDEKSRLTVDDVLYIIEAEFKYTQEKGEVNNETINYIQDEGKKNNKNYSTNDIKRIFNIEMEYEKSIGIKTQ